MDYIHFSEKMGVGDYSPPALLLLTPELWV